MQHNYYNIGEYTIYGSSRYNSNNVVCLATGINGEVLEYKIQELKQLGYENVYSVKTRDNSNTFNWPLYDGTYITTTTCPDEIPFCSGYKMVNNINEITCYTVDCSKWFNEYNLRNNISVTDYSSEYVKVPYIPCTTAYCNQHNTTDYWAGKKPVIICLVGESGTGKTTLARELNDTYNIPAICSYTTRPMRDGEENYVDHIFVNDDTYNETDKAEMLAYTVYGGYHYWTKHSQVRLGLNVYVIDKRGLDEFKSKWSDAYNIISVLITRDKRDNIDEARKHRDLENPTGTDYDIIINNNYNTLQEFFGNAIDKIRSFVKKCKDTGKF